MAKVGSIKKCERCGKEFEVHFPSEKYCCRKCYSESVKIAVAESNYKINEKRAKGETIEKVCVVCGTPFLTKRIKNLCCSGECSLEYHKNYTRDKYRIEHNVLKEKQCVVCGATFTMTNGRQVCCSPECGKEYRKDKIRSYTNKVETQKRRKKKPKPLPKVLEEMKAEGYQPHEYGKYMAMQYMKNNQLKK